MNAALNANGCNALIQWTITLEREVQLMKTYPYYLLSHDKWLNSIRYYESDLSSHKRYIQEKMASAYP